MINQIFISKNKSLTDFEIYNYCSNRVKELSKEYGIEYKLWTYDDIRDTLFKKLCSKDTIEQFDSLYNLDYVEYNTFITDIARMLVVFTEGKNETYLDNDIYITEPAVLNKIKNREGFYNYESGVIVKNRAVQNYSILNDVYDCITAFMYHTMNCNCNICRRNRLQDTSPHKYLAFVEHNYNIACAWRRKGYITGSVVPINLFDLYRGTEFRYDQNGPIELIHLAQAAYVSDDDKPWVLKTVKELDQFLNKLNNRN